MDTLIGDILATVWPRHFREHAHRMYLRKFRKVQALERRRAKEAFNSHTPSGFGQACSDTIKMILEGGSDYFARNGIHNKNTRRK